MLIPRVIYWQDSHVRLCMLDFALCTVLISQLFIDRDGAVAGCQLSPRWGTVFQRIGPRKTVTLNVVRHVGGSCCERYLDKRQHTAEGDCGYQTLSSLSCGFLVPHCDRSLDICCSLW